MWRIVAAIAAFFFLGTGAAQAEWRRGESPNFIMVGNLSESALRERILLLEDFDHLLRMLTPGEEPPAPTKLHVYVVSGLDALRVVQPTLPAGIDGFYAASDDGILAMINGSNGDAGNEILFHEYAHHFMMQNSAQPYPAWFVEGYAEYLATVHFVGNKINIGQFSPGRVASLQGEWLPIDRVLSAGPLGLSQSAMSAYYAESWLVTHYFYSTPERQAVLSRLLAAQHGGNPVEELRSATGLTPDAMTRALRSYISGGVIRYRQMERAPAAAPPVVAITMLPRSAQDLIIYEAALRLGVSDQNGPTYLQRIRTIAARYPDDPLAMRVLADIELHFGDGAAADRLLDRLLVATPNDAELLYLKGMRWLIAAESDNPPEGAGATARQWFGRAQRADQNHWQTFFRYAQSLRGEPAFRSENTRNALLLAHQLAPQVNSITINAASLLMSRREYGYAIALLRPLVGNPHDARLASIARQMVEQAETAMRAAAAAAPASAVGGVTPGS